MAREKSHRERAEAALQHAQDRAFGEPGDREERTIHALSGIGHAVLALAEAMEGLGGQRSGSPPPQR